MSGRRLRVAVAFVAIVVSPLLLECAITCQLVQVENQNDFPQGRCPVKLTSVPSRDPGATYSECVTVHVRMKAADFRGAQRIEILPIGETIPPTRRKRKNKRKGDNRRKQRETRGWCDSKDLFPQSNTSAALWELVYDCVNTEAGEVVLVSYSTASTSCNVSYTVPDPIPDFNLSVNRSSKSVTVTVEPGDKVHTRWCYRKDAHHCMAGKPSPQITIDPSQTQSALLDLPYLLPCICVQAYYTYVDSRRHKKCPFQDEGLVDVRDVWRSSEVTLYESSFIWKSVCPASDLKISASLCWRQREHLCTPVPNATLEGTDGVQNWFYNTSALDKHPQMCVQFSLQGSHHISCPFQADMSSWEVYMVPGRRSLMLHLTSFVPAKFSAQLCVLNETGCTPMGEVHSGTVDGRITDAKINVPVYFFAEKPCVQVWQSDPSLKGRRVLCPEYTHNRYGIYAMAAFISVVLTALLGIFTHRLTKSGTAGWFCIKRPVLLVCSSDQSAHVSAVCALASILQGDLSATVHMALWALSSQTQAGTGTGVADLGPLPWLYGQWESVRKAQGKMLIVWSPEAKNTYEREERASVERNEDDYSKAEVRHKKIRVELEEDLTPNDRRLGKCKNQKAARKNDCVKSCDYQDWYPQSEPSTVIAPVFTAALACLEGCKGQGVAIVYFQGLCHSRDIPKAFRGVPRYCLPQDFRGLMQELGGLRRQTKNRKFGWHCWPRLLSKALSVWLAHQLAQRLQTLLPQMQGKKTQEASVTSTLTMMSDKKRRRLRLPPASADTARPGTVPEHEPLHESPWRTDKL